MQFTNSGVDPSGVTAVLKALKDSPGCFEISLSHEIIIAAQASRVVDSSVVVKTGPTEMALITGNLAAAERCLFVHLQSILPNSQSAVILHLIAVEDRQVTVPKGMVIATMVPVSLVGAVVEEVDGFDEGSGDEDVGMEELLDGKNKTELMAFAEAYKPRVEVDMSMTRAVIIETTMEAMIKPDEDD